MILHKERYNKFKTPVGYYIELKDIINKDYSDKDSFYFNILKGITILFRKGNVKDSNPYFIHKGKKVEGLATFSHGNIVSIPFINEENGEFFEGYSNHYKSILVHELTHIFQRLSDINKISNSNEDDYKTWLSRNHEQEAILNQVFSAIRSFIKEEIDMMQRYRKEKMIRPYVMKNNKLQELFSSKEVFSKMITKDYDDIFKSYVSKNKSSIRNHYVEFGIEYPKLEKEFLYTTWEDLKSEFKNVIPDKKLKYGVLK